MRTVLLTLVATVTLSVSLHAQADGVKTGLLSSEPAQSPQGFVWAPRTLHHFTRPLAITSETDGWREASCDQIYNTVKALLLEFGARSSDLNVDQRPCYAPTRPKSVDVNFSVLVPSDQAGPHHDGTVSAARWQKVALQGNCSYLQYVTKAVLPLFTTRDVKLITTADCAKIGIGLYAQLLIPSGEAAPSP